MSSRNKRKSKSGKSNSGHQNSQKKPSPTAQILEHVELLIALHEEERDESGISTGNADSSAMVDDLAKKLESQFGKRFDALEDKLADSNLDQGENSSTDSSALESLVERFDAIESKLTTIEETIQHSDGHDGTSADVQSRFEAIDTRLEKVAEAIAGQQTLIEDRSPTSDASVIESIQEQFSQMMSQMKEELATVAVVNSNLGPDAESEDEEDSTRGPNWSRQKEAMLSKYGIDPEHRPDMAPPTEPDPVLETTLADKELSEELAAAVNLETDDTISTEPEEIQKIRKELNSKLRDAEVELSIERAKLSQLEAELESKQVELERRDSELSEKFKGQKSNDASQSGEVSLLDRLKRHLTAKDRKNLDRI